MNNKTFSRENKEFIACCKKALVDPTMRQASKFRRGLGLAYTIKGLLSK